MAAAITIRRARLADVLWMQDVIAASASEGLMLHRTHAELYETMRDFFVAERDGQPLGVCALHLFSKQIAEVKALAVDAKARGQGVGRILVHACCDEAKAIGLERVFCLTYQVEFFTRCGFEKVDRSRLPEKVWGECVRCRRFLECDEVAMWKTV